MTAWHPVKATNIDKVAFEGGKLLVLFRGGNAVFAYARVPKKLFEGLLATDDVQRFFSHNIRGRFVHTKRTPSERAPTVL